MFKLLLDLLYPPRCMVCRDIIGIGAQGCLCPACGGEFEAIKGDVCVKCGVPCENIYGVCAGCEGGTHSLESNYALFLYQGRERELVINLKYHLGPYMSGFIKDLIADSADMSKLSGFDYIIPVPMYKRKETDRGYNQAVILAQAVSAVTGTPVLKNILVRFKNTNAQSGLNRFARQSNVKGAFRLRDKKKIINAKAILLVDDIYTTGSTMNECAGVILSGGAKSVNGFTFNAVSGKGGGRFGFI